MAAELNDAFWAKLVNRIEWHEVIPVVGPGAVTFGPDDKLLYPWLTQQLPGGFDLTFKTPPRDLQEIVDALRANNTPISRIYTQLHKILVEKPPLPLLPGTTLAALAAVEDFRLFISTTFDSLLPLAVESVSPGGKPEERRGAFSIHHPCDDLPKPLAELSHRFVYQIFGKVRPEPDFVVWDDNVFQFLVKLSGQLDQLNNLKNALGAKGTEKELFDLLVLGLRFDHWLLRFFVQVVKGKPLSELAVTDKQLDVFEQLDTSESQNVVAYFGRLTQQIHVFPIDPIKFIGELHQRWCARHPRPADDPYLINKGHREKHGAPGCIFVSYASPDLEIARYVVSQLQEAGCLVWFDKEQVLPGQNRQEVVGVAVEERCGLFLSLMSRQSSQERDSDTQRERKMAVKRRDEFADNAVFYVPIRIDNGDPLIPDNEPHSIKKIWPKRCQDGDLGSDLIGQLRDLQRQYCKAHDLPPP